MPNLWEEPSFAVSKKIITNISHYEYRPVDVDNLIAIHNEKMVKRFDVVLEGSIADNYEMDEHISSKEHNPAESS